MIVHKKGVNDVGITIPNADGASPVIGPFAGKSGIDW
jgi:hypothetical protein